MRLGLIDKGNAVGVIDLDIHKCMELCYFKTPHDWNLTVSSPPSTIFSRLRCHHIAGEVWSYEDIFL